MTDTVRFNPVSIFSSYFASLCLSLMGKTEDASLVYLQVHDLRERVIGKYRSIDGTPYDGGVGIIMRADVWVRVLDEVFAMPLVECDDDGAQVSPHRILVTPMLSGAPLT